MTRLRAICTAVALVCASGQVFADAASHAASAETFLKLAHADKLGTPVYMQVQQMFAQRFEQTKAPAARKPCSKPTRPKLTPLWTRPLVGTN